MVIFHGFFCVSQKVSFLGSHLKGNSEARGSSVNEAVSGTASIAAVVGRNSSSLRPVPVTRTVHGVHGSMFSGLMWVYNHGIILDL